ncbi:hypothetical protein EJB05_34375 [Eragrostis curvula]|uniref:Mitochondrial import inner membrane translocase subunit n=1 Tax=Eragrostis curvula TaxID=38414 RepID=A0A5J9U3U3_9POAL|nr:hypothetical protein EJB05_34375 [Eragrostis curvula]
MDAAAATTSAVAAVDEEVDQARLTAIAEGLQNRDAVRLYNSLSQRCFSDCVVTFYRKTLGKREADCVKACVRKYLLLTTASAARFAELADSSFSAAAASDD